MDSRRLASAWPSYSRKAACEIEVSLILSQSRAQGNCQKLRDELQVTGGRVLRLRLRLYSWTLRIKRHTPTAWSFEYASLLRLPLTDKSCHGEEALCLSMYRQKPSLLSRAVPTSQRTLTMHRGGTRISNLSNGKQSRTPQCRFEKHDLDRYPRAADRRAS